MQRDAAIIERYEMKYRIPPELVDPIRDAIAPYCVPDRANQGGRYIISSLYIDSPNRRLYSETQNQVAKRYKLRVRRYDRTASYVEIKRRIKGIVHKTRTRLEGDLWPRVFHDPRLLAGLSLSPPELRNVNDFINRCLRLSAEPAAVVRYRREAYVSTIDDYGRVTFDHQLEAAPPQSWDVPVDDGPIWIPVDRAPRYGLIRSGVVLELKCTMTVPAWMTDLVHQFKLRRGGFSKYATCLEQLEPQRVSWGLPASGRLQSARRWRR